MRWGRGANLNAEPVSTESGSDAFECDVKDTQCKGDANLVVICRLMSTYPHNQIRCNANIAAVSYDNDAPVSLTWGLSRTMAGLKSKLYRSVDWCQPIRTKYVWNKCQSLNWYDSKWTKSDNNAFESDFEVVFNFYNAKVDASLVVICRQMSTYPHSQIIWDAMQMQLLMSYDNYAPGWDLTWGQCKAMAGLKSKLYRSVDWCQPIRTKLSAKSTKV